MQKFEYRTPRYQVDLPVLLNLRDSTIVGRCREISIEGMRVELPQPVFPDACGTVSISYRELSLELPVCVAHSGTGQDGLKFLFESEEDRSGVERLVSLLAGPTDQPGPVLVR
jgi:PilZ domain